MSKEFKVINPYTGDEVNSFHFSHEADIEKALTLLKEGESEVKKMSSQQRANILFQLAEVLKKNQQKMAEMISLEMGKTIKDAQVEMARAVDTIVCSAEEAKRISGESIDADSWGSYTDKTAVVKRFPLGIIAAITPFNFPINLAAHKIGPAFAAGNTILFKPHPQCFFSSKKLLQCCYEAGMSEKMIQLVCPDLSEMPLIIKDKRVRCISLTGGIHAAESVCKTAGVKKLLFELGGNDPLVVMDDARIEQAVDVAINQRFGTAGQRCTAAKRVFIHENIYEEFQSLLLEKTEKLKVGDPLNPETFVGPVVSEKVAEDALRRIESAVASGAKLLMGGKRQGALLWPTIVENVSMDCELVADETFAPIIPLFKFSQIEEVIKLINSSDFGLQSGLFTNKLDIIKKFYSEIEVGAVAINDGPGYRKEHLPFGGVKKSGIGREGVKYAIEEMSYTKSLIF